MTRCIPVTLLAALGIFTAACGEPSPPDATPADAEGSAEAVPVQVVVEPEIIAPPAPPPRPTPPEPLPEEPEPAPQVERPAADSLALTPRYDVGDTLRRAVDWTSTTDITLDMQRETAHSLLETSVRATYEVRITEVDKGAATEAHIHFESFARHHSGRDTVLVSDPARGDVWTCTLSDGPPHCASDEIEAFDAPPWLALSFDALAPARYVRPAETWSRRVGIAHALGLTTSATARATLQAEPPYEHDDALLTTLTVTFDADDVVPALGRPVRIRGEGNAALEIDLNRRQVVALDAEWSGTARARARRNDTMVAFERDTSIIFRVTSLDE